MLLAVTINTPHFFGVDGFWAGVIWTLLLLIAVPIVGFILFLGYMEIEEWWMDRRNDFDPSDEYLSPEVAGVGKGVLVCDYVDSATLSSIGVQKQITPEPTESEKGESVTRGVTAGAEKAGLIARIIRSRREDSREKFEHQEDPNLVLRKVLVKLARDQSLNQSIVQVPYVPLVGEEGLGRLVDLARDIEGVAEARDQVSELQDRLIAEEKLKEFAQLKEANSFQLVESSWTVAVADGQVTLRLLELRPQGYGPSDYQAERVPMPAGAEVNLTVPANTLTDQGNTRLIDGREVRAGVFARMGGLSGNVLTLMPVAIFERIAASSDIEY